MDDNFLLETELSRRLYFECARDLPVIDYHNHLSVVEIAEDRRFESITQLWIASDPYKHRAMRICGVGEEYITGNASDYEKFMAWSGVLPKLIGNPIYHWSLMELKEVFQIETPLNPGNAADIWSRITEMLKKPELTAKNLLQRFHVEYSAPCCDIFTELSGFSCLSNLAPSLRGDGMLPLRAEWVGKLEKISGIKIRSLHDLRNALSKRLDAFHRQGCRFADHALDDGFRYVPDDQCNERRFQQVLAGVQPDSRDDRVLSSELLRMLGGEYAKRGWVMQLHMGAIRETSSRLRNIAGPAGGFAGIGKCSVRDIVALLDDLEQKEMLPRTILFPLNPSDQEALCVLGGSFTGTGMPGKVQLGAAWWWCDHIRGIREVLETFSSYGVLSVFYGMTTDSRSLLSLVRHDYFRRILCGWLGEKAERMELPEDFSALGGLVESICYGNGKKILGGMKDGRVFPG